MMIDNTLSITGTSTPVLSVGVIQTANIADGAVTNDKLSSGAVTQENIQADAVTFAKIQNITAGKLLGRKNTEAGSTMEITVSTGLNLDSGGILSVNHKSYILATFDETSSTTTTISSSSASTGGFSGSISATNFVSVEGKLTKRLSINSGNFTFAATGTQLDVTRSAVADLPAKITCSLCFDGADPKTYGFSIVKNGTFISGSLQQARITTANDVRQVSITCATTLKNNDAVKLYAGNYDGTQNLVVRNVAMEILEI